MFLSCFLIFMKFRVKFLINVFLINKTGCMSNICGRIAIIFVIIRYACKGIPARDGSIIVWPPMYSLVLKQHTCGHGPQPALI